MVLISTSKRFRESFGVESVSISAAVPTDQWYRFWRVDAVEWRLERSRRASRVLVTNMESCYTFVFDASVLRDVKDLLDAFLRRYAVTFRRFYAATEKFEEQFQFHRGVDRRTVALMNEFIYLLGHYADETPETQEAELNTTPIIARGGPSASARLAQLLSK